MQVAPTLGLIPRDQLMQELLIADTRERALRTRSVDPLPHLRLGRQVFYDPLAVRRWLERQTRRQTRARLQVAQSGRALPE